MMDALVDGYPAVFLTQEQIELYGGPLDAMAKLGSVTICHPYALYTIMALNDPSVPFFEECGHA